MPDVPQLLKRYERMKSERQQYWDAGFQEIADFIHPTQNQFVVKTNPGAKQTEKIFDSTALDAHDRLASTLNGTLTSRATAWFSLKISNDKYDDDVEVKEWLEDSALRMFRAFNRCNFAQEIHEVYLDESALGTAGLFLEERKPESKKFEGFVFRAVPLHSFYIDEDAEGKVNTVFRHFELSAGAAVAKWPTGLGPKVLKAIEDDKPDTMFKFLHIVMPRAGASETPTPRTSKFKLPWASYYIGILDKNLISEGGFHEFPFMIPRWTKSSSEKYGRGPGHMALPDVKTLNKIKQITLQMMAKLLNPPTKSLDDGIVGPIRAQPSGNTIVRDMERSIEPLFPAGMLGQALQNEQIKSSELIVSVKRYFYADQMELPTGPAMTAFEVSKRFELLQRLLGPTMGRQETELLNPLIARAFGIMFRHGALADTPKILLQDDAEMDVVYEGPLAKSQRLAEVEGMERLQQFVMGAAQVDPNVIDLIDYDEAVRVSADVLSVPSKIIRDPDTVAKFRQQRAQQQQQQQQLAETTQVAAAAGKAAPALKLLPGGTGTQWAGIPAGGSAGPGAA